VKGSPTAILLLKKEKR